MHTFNSPFNGLKSCGTPEEAVVVTTLVVGRTLKRLVGTGDDELPALGFSTSTYCPLAPASDNFDIKQFGNINDVKN